MSGKALQYCDAILALLARQTAVSVSICGVRASVRSAQRPFVACGLCRTHRKKQALCRRSIGTDSLLQMTN
jgi:hypothetical protein